MDDNLLIGHPKAIEDAIEQMKKHGFILKIEDDLNDNLSCEIQFSKDRTKAWLGLPHLISTLIYHLCCAPYSNLETLIAANHLLDFSAPYPLAIIQPV